MFCAEIQERWNRIAGISAGSRWLIESEGGVVKGIIKVEDMDWLGKVNRGIQKWLPAIPRSRAKALDNVVLLNAYYGPQCSNTQGGSNCSNFMTCAAGAAKPHPMTLATVRAWMIRNLVDPPSAPSAAILRTDPPVAGQSDFSSALVTLAAHVLTKEVRPGGPEVLLRQKIAAAPGTSLAPWIPQGKTWLRTLQGEREAVVAAVCAVIGVTGVADVVAWPILWSWAAGAPPGGPAPLIPTRAAALTALGSIASRNSSFVGRSTVDALQRVAASVATLPPPVSRPEEQERQAFALAAGFAINSMVGALSLKDIVVPPELTNPETYLPPGTPPPGSIPIWVPVVGGLGLAAAIAGGLLLRRAQRS